METIVKPKLTEAELEYLRRQFALFCLVWSVPLPDKRWQNISYRPFNEWGTPRKNEIKHEN
jgi:hypothetical protein